MNFTLILDMGQFMVQKAHKKGPGVYGLNCAD